MRGRKPKPTYLRLLQGNPGHRPLNTDEPEPEGNLIDAPETFSDRQRALWTRTLLNVPDGLLRRLDLGIFTSYIVNLAEFLDADRKVQTLGSVVKTPGGQPMQNPYVSIRNRANNAMVKAASELGFSPSSRSRVKVNPKKKAKSALGQLREFKIDG
jgi:P27 family predicted phage terminase small subunit